MLRTPPTVGCYHTPPGQTPGWGGSQSGDLDAQIAEWVRRIRTDGHATTDTGTRPVNHYIAGIGGGHQDDRFADVGVSQVAWAENDCLNAPTLTAVRAAQAAARAARDKTPDTVRAAVYAALRAAFAKARAGA